jgi:hypothetical protein
MSAFDRLPADYRKLCEEIAAASGKISPQNRRVRDHADRIMIARKPS